MNSTLTLTSLCGICTAVNITIMLATLLFVRFNKRSAAHKITKIAKAARAELKGAGLVIAEGSDPISDLGSVMQSMSAALRAKSDRVFYLENKIRHLGEHTNATERRERSGDRVRSARRARYSRRLRRGEIAEQNKRAREHIKAPPQPFSSADLFRCI